MEGISFDSEALHFCVGDFNALLVDAFVKLAFYLQSSVGRSRSDQLDDCHSTGKRSAAPILCNVAKHPMLDAVSLGCAWRIVMDMQDEARFVCEPLQFYLPQPDARAV
jgi:hypothetical protein